MKSLLYVLFILLCPLTTLNVVAGDTTATEQTNQSNQPETPNSIIEIAKISGLVMGAATCHSILNDLVTAHVSPEYFTHPAHPAHYYHSLNNFKLTQGKLRINPANGHLENTDYVAEPWKIALKWGTFVSLHEKALFAIAIALASQVGSWEKLNAQDLLKPMGLIFGGTALASTVAGLAAYKYNNPSGSGPENHWPTKWLRETQYYGQMVGRNYTQILGENRARKFLANGAAHNAAYIALESSGLGLIGWILYKRYKKTREAREKAEEADDKDEATG